MLQIIEQVDAVLIRQKALLPRCENEIPGRNNQSYPCGNRATVCLVVPCTLELCQDCFENYDFSW